MEDYSDIPISDQVAWNLDGALLGQIGNLLQNSTNNYLTGNIEKAFYYLKTVRQRIVHCLKENEREKCFAVEKRFKKNFYSPINQQKEYGSHKYAQFDIYDEFNTIIMDLLQKYGYVGKKREDNTRINV